MTPTATANLGAMASALRNHHVEFVVIGGAAAAAWGATRRPTDLDVVIRGTIGNAHAIAGALTELHARGHFPEFGTDAERHLANVGVTAELIQRLPISTWMTDHGELDLFDSILTREQRSRSWDDLRPGSQHRQVDGVTVDVASIDTIISSKLAVARPSDLADVDELRRIAAERVLRSCTSDVCGRSWDPQRPTGPDLDGPRR